MSNYRIVRIAGLHHIQLINKLYKDDPDFLNLTYEKQQNVIFEMGYLYSDSLSKGMRSLGHDAFEILFDVEMLQKKWAKENDFRYSPEDWRLEILIRQIEVLKPDILYFQDIHSMPQEIRKSLKNRISNIRIIALFKGFPGSVKSFNELSDVDIVFAGTPYLNEKFKDAGLNSYLVYHYFNKSVLKKLNEKKLAERVPEFDFVFTGSSGYGYGGHRGRFWLLVELIKRTDIKLWIADREDGIRDGLDKLPKIVRDALDNNPAWAETLGDLPPQPLRKMYPSRCLPAVFGLDMYRLLQNSKVTLNKDPDALLDNVGNIRLFEATGAGTCVLTNSGTNMAELFEEDSEVVTYSSIDECIEKMNYLLGNEDVRKRIANAGQRRALKNHTMYSRCQELDDLFQNML